MNQKDIVAGLGEIGNPILKLLSKNSISIGFDIDKKLMNIKKFEKYANAQTKFLHICIPFGKNFEKNVLNLVDQFSPLIVVIHSTISPYTTSKLQEKLTVPVIYSATRGIHQRMLSDLKKYTKFYAIEKSAPKSSWASNEYRKLLKLSNVKSRKVSSPITLELAKIVCDTSYYGWLINYAQISNMIANEHKVDYDEMWSFSDEIHKFLGNRPKMYPGYIGGHCVIPNLDLIHHQTLDLIKQLNQNYLKKTPKAKSINKKYTKSKKQSYDV
ncbi:GDP-mannose dehydrogenase [Nitrosopumilus sp.]|uniref:GDP-mannose dehydrogenase n=1 Tax=Nitrosopumilus sp. TaxID=2024843 RepID=UPI00262E50D9|nr:GDP-mannose dehydrogenase [Nitrosopumilus sp.]